MTRSLIGRVGAAVVIAAILVALDARDFAQEPATDNADAVATLAVVAGAVAWLLLRRVDRPSPTIQLLTDVAVGIAIGALVVGLASVVFDPFAS